MVAYNIALRGAQPALAVVAAHGLTDLDSFDWIPAYFAWCLVPDVLVTPGFVVASVVHFSYDIGRLGSMALHGAVGVLCLAWGQHLAFRVMLYYLATIHVPLHYRRCLVRGRVVGVFFAATATAVLLAFSRGVGDVFFFGNWLQRIAAAHIVHEFLLDTRYPERGPARGP